MKPPVRRHPSEVSARSRVGAATRPRLLSAALLVVLAGTGCQENGRQISRSGAGAYEASLAALGDGFAVAWYDQRDGRTEIYLRRTDPNGRPIGPEHRLTETAEASFEASLDAITGGFVIGWYDRAEPESYVARLGMWSEAGEPLWSRVVSDRSRNGRIPVVRVAQDRILVAWLQDDGETFEVWGGWWNLAGKAIGEATRLAPAGRTTWNLNAAIDPTGRAWIVFDAEAGTRAEEVYLVVFDSVAAAPVRLTGDDGRRSRYPDLAIGPGVVALSWQDGPDGSEDVYLVVAPPAAFSGAVESRAARITSGESSSVGAYLAWNGERLGLAWSDDSGGRYDIRFRSFDIAGNPLEPVRRITRTRSSSMIPSIRPAGDGFAIAWNEYLPADREPHGRGRSEVHFLTIR